MATELVASHSGRRSCSLFPVPCSLFPVPFYEKACQAADVAATRVSRGTCVCFVRCEVPVSPFYPHSGSAVPSRVHSGVRSRETLLICSAALPATQGTTAVAQRGIRDPQP